MEKICQMPTHASFQKFFPQPEYTYYPYFSHHNLTLLIFELYKNGIICYVIFCVWLLLLNIMFNVDYWTLWF